MADFFVYELWTLGLALLLLHLQPAAAAAVTEW